MATLWMMVTRDELELPIIVADTAEELAKLAGVSASCVKTVAWKHERGMIRFARYRKVEIEDEESGESDLDACDK